MGYRNFVSLNVAILGAGEAGRAFAATWATAGHQVYLAWNDEDASSRSAMVTASIGNFHLCSIDEAAAVADVIVLTCQPVQVREYAYLMGDVRRKTIIDATASGFQMGTQFVPTMGAVEAITGSRNIVKICAMEKGAEEAFLPIFKQRVNLLVAGGSRKAKELVKIMAADLGLDCWYDIGDREQIGLFDELTCICRNLAEVYNKKRMGVNVFG